MAKYAHKTENGEKQTIKAHLEGTAKLAEENAVGLFKPIAHALGMAHDIGKYADAFQNRLLNDSTERFEHSACGALEYEKMYRGSKINEPFFAPLMEYCIACHHTGLQNGRNKNESGNTLKSRVYPGRKERDYIGKGDYDSYKEEITLESPDFSFILDCLQEEKTPVDRIELYSFFVRYLFSCLTDADFIDTERFCCPNIKRDLYADFTAAAVNLESKFKSCKKDTLLQQARSRLQEQAFNNVEKGVDVNILNMPAGSGKTLCSLKIALDKLNSDKSKKRIIYVIPYTAIIDQTAEEFIQIFEKCAEVLQHHSNYIFNEDTENNSTEEKLRLACENWDAPVVITTAVQFFESVYSCKSSSLRKLHNMADSVIVFDEIHTLPTECLQPCIRAIGYITRYLNSEAIFLSATMPDYSRLFERYAPKMKVKNLITDKEDFKYFKKEIYKKIDADFEKAAKMAEDFKTALIITNSRKSARDTYSLLSGNKYHISTYMTPFDRKRVIDEIKTDLSDNKSIKVVSTSLVEAGIDLDFEAVFRQMNGLDSILQAGGRCNREGKNDKGCVFVFKPLSENPSQDIRRLSTERLFEAFEDITDPKCIERYYNDIFLSNEQKIKANTITENRFVHLAEINFKDYSEKFQLIKEETVGVVIVQNEDCRSILKELKSNRRLGLRKLQRYTVPLKCRGDNSEFMTASKKGIVKKSEEGIFTVEDMKYYDPEIGLNVELNDDIIV